MFGVLALTVMRRGHTPVRGLGLLCIGVSQLASTIDPNRFLQMTSGQISRDHLAVGRGERVGQLWNLAVSVLTLLGVALVAYPSFLWIGSILSGWFR